MKYLLAVSGGVDSVVLLDKLAREGTHEIIVAHFDHGIRDDSAADARFVGELAKAYGVPFVMQREELGKTASEELGRRRRYAFLKAEAGQRGATIATAHHGDDIVETVAINLIRGTGWRGLAVLDSETVVRPLLGMMKNAIREYALAHRLEWVEDSTNNTNNYLRNRIRRKIAACLTPGQKQAVMYLRNEQVVRKNKIDSELLPYIAEDGKYDRHFFTFVDKEVGCELLRAAITVKTGMSPMRPQCERALLAVKTAQPRSVFEVGGGVRLVFGVRNFVVQTP